MTDSPQNEGPSSLPSTKTFLGHPRGLMILFFSEMWERFCYYGMRALLTLYLIDSIMKGNNEAFGIYGAYTALVYAAPVIAGKVADKILGYRIAIILGGILMSIGEFLILGGSESWLYIGMATIIVGNGYFKANISSVVGKLYEENDPRRDSGFTIFYIGINVGAFLATTIVAQIGSVYGYKWGFAMAGVGMMAGFLIFYLGRKLVYPHAEPPNPQKLYAPFLGPLNLQNVTILASLAVIPMLYVLFTYYTVVGWLLAATAIYVVFNLLSTAFSSDSVQRDKIFMLIILMLFNVVFWAFFEQAGTSLTIFARDHINRTFAWLGNWEMAAATTQFYNPFFILVLGSIFSWMWVKLDKMKMNPNIPAKFGLGIAFLGFGYLLVPLSPVSATFLIPHIIIILLYFFHTTGELFISPIGLSMVTKLAPKDLTGTVMGAWFLTFAGANFLAGQIAQLTGTVEGGDGVEMTRAESFMVYEEVYTNIGLFAMGTGLFLILISPVLKKLLHGVR